MRQVISVRCKDHSTHIVVMIMFEDSLQECTAISYALPPWFVSVAWYHPLAVLQSLTVPSELAEAVVFPSGGTATPYASLV